MHDLITFATAMLTITNPVGSMALFAGLTSDDSDAERRSAALQTGLAVAAIMLLVTWTGGYLLSAFGVSIPGLQMAGGVIIALMGLSMLRSKTSEMAHTPEEHKEAKAKDSIAIVPMAIPIIAGPGAMTTIVLATHTHHAAKDRVAISLICVGVAAVIWIGLRFAGPAVKRLGVSGVNIVTRVMGIVLTAIALQMLADGLKAALPGLGAAAS